MRIEIAGVSVNAKEVGELVYLSFYQVRRVKRALGILTRGNSDGIGDTRFQWVRNIRTNGWSGALFRQK